MLKHDRRLVHCVGTDIPPLPLRMFTLWGCLLEKIELKESNVLSMDDVFKDTIYSKKQRFEMISYLIRRKLIKRARVDHLCHEYISIPKDRPENSSGAWIYDNLNRDEMRSLIKDLMKEKKGSS